MVARKSKLGKKRGNGQGSSIPVFIHSLWRSGSTSNRLAAGKSYLSFYLLWCLGLLEGLVNADLLLNIDALSGSQSYQAEINKHFFHFNIMDLDFQTATYRRDIIQTQTKPSLRCLRIGFIAFFY